MPNIASVLKEEIARLARKELRGETGGLKKASAQHRSDIAALKRRVAAIEQMLVRLDRKGNKPAAPPDAEAGPRIRFSAKGLGAQRQRLGLSAAEAGALIGVSAQTVYNWEAGSTHPRPQQLAAIAALRHMGKREASARLQALAEQAADN